MKGFLTADAPTKKPLPLVAQCGSCQLYKHCKSPKMPVDGKGKRKILVLGESPGSEEDEQGRPFVGVSGQLVNSTLAKFGINFREDCWIYNSCICHPEKNELPPAAIGYCRPNVVKIIQELKPRTIILLGASAVKSVIGWQWKEDVGAAGRWDGWVIPSQKLNAFICPTWHPSYVLRMDRQDGSNLARLFFEKHLEVACNLRGRPWPEGVPDFERQVHLEYDPDAAAKMIDTFTEHGAEVAFDIETDRLHPYHEDASIVCCSVCNGAGSVAFPWHGAAIDAMKRLLVSDVPKWGWNCKFEHTWLRKKLGVWVNNWQWDGMLGTHVLDNRSDICSLAFQCFVRLGFDYKDETSKYMKAKGSNEKNKVREAPLDRMLHRCAMDSLVEFKIAELQRKEMGL